jgi:hypothetical protein
LLNTHETSELAWPRAASPPGADPFGFRRWLVRADGARVRQLAEGECVKMAGHHVVWLPGPEEELALIRRILEMLEVAAALAALGGDIAPDVKDLSDVGRLFQTLNARMLFRFDVIPLRGGRWKKRVIRKMVSGVVTFGTTAPPVPIYDGPTGRKKVKSPTTPKESSGPSPKNHPEFRVLSPVRRVSR